MSLASLPDSQRRRTTAQLARFYALHAPIYDWTRPFILYGRSALLRGLSLRQGATALDVGCGTGYSAVRLARGGTNVVAIDSSPAMLKRAERRARRAPGPSGVVSFDARPYGTHGAYACSADLVLFSYSLSMMPNYREAVGRACADLRAGGHLAVVDFLTATHPLVSWWLRANHVYLGADRLDTLKRHLPRHTVEIRHAGLWRYFLFWGER